jgi:cysteine synthase A
MTVEEIELSKSTPGFRFDVAAPAKPAHEAPPVPAAKPAAKAFVEEMIGDKDQPVTLFALEWCEFCWSVRKLFKEMDIPYRAIDLDSVEYQKDNWGGDIRGALLEKLHSPTIPQIFVGGEHVGGCTETFDAINDHSFQKMLQENSVKFDTAKEVEAYSFLPKWLVPR